MSQVEEIQSHIDIVELVKRYATLKKAGTNYKALCPFPWHTEKTPSFIVSPSKQLAYCFGCHKWWGPLKFIMDVEWCEFRDALEILASITGVQLKGYDKKEELLKKNIYSLFHDITKYYQKALQNHPQVQKYMTGRNISKESQEIFHIGYADSGIELYNYLKNKRYDDSLIEESNVFIDLKSRKDKFISRVIFPIQNNRWDIVGFAGRIIDIGEPKYLNSPASLVYDKSNILYGLYQARNEIAKKDFIIITEWYLDTIALHQAGYQNTVCVSGTALTEKHIALIKKLTSKIYLCFDGDQAGKNATKLAIEMLKNKDIEVKIIVFETGKDPDEIISSGENFDIYIKQALTPIGYFLSHIGQTDSLQDKKQILSQLLHIIKWYQDHIEKDYFLKEVAHKLDIKLEVVYSEFNKTKLPRTPSVQNQNKTHHFKSDDLLIGYLIKYPEKISEIKENILLSKYLKWDIKEVLEKWVKVISEFSLEKQTYYMALSQNDEAIEMKAQVTSNEGKNKETLENDIKKLLYKFQLDIIKDISQELSKKIQWWDKKALEAYQELLKIKKEL